MNELYKHIEVLLLENDCVIVPGLGGFIAHYRSAVQKGDGRFQPPMRSIGFNPQLVMNDGLLVQSYMQTYNTDFPDATRKIEKVVSELKEELYQHGQATFGHVGTLYYNMNGVYEFAPSSDHFFTPSLYGLDGFDCSPLSARPAATLQPQVPPVLQETSRQPDEQTISSRQRRPFRHWWQNAAAAVAAILLFFVLSVPVENTYVEETNYASLGSASLFEAIRNQSMASTVKIPREIPATKGQQSQTVNRQRSNVNTLKPVKVSTEKVSAPKEPVKEATKEPMKEAVKEPVKAAANTTVKETPKAVSPAAGKCYYVIVASLGSRADARKEIERLAQMGYPDATLVERDGKFRVALSEHTQAAAAYRQVNELKTIERFRSAWVYTANH